MPTRLCPTLPLPFGATFVSNEIARSRWRDQNGGSSRQRTRTYRSAPAQAALPIITLILEMLSHVGQASRTRLFQQPRTVVTPRLERFAFLTSAIATGFGKRSAFPFIDRFRERPRRLAGRSIVEMSASRSSGHSEEPSVTAGYMPVRLDR